MKVMVISEVSMPAFWLEFKMKEMLKSEVGITSLLWESHEVAKSPMLTQLRQLTEPVSSWTTDPTSTRRTARVHSSADTVAKHWIRRSTARL